MKRIITSLILTFLISLSPILYSLALAHPVAANRAPLLALPFMTGGGAQTSEPPGDRGWPRGYRTPSGAQIVLYQPQAASWENQRHLVAFAAASCLPNGKQKPELGTLKVEADTEVSLTERLVKFSVLKITEANFPTLPKEQTQELITEIDKTIPAEDRYIALDRVLSQIDKSEITPKNVPGVKGDPPKIFTSQTPAILLNVDGYPIWSSIKENELKFAVNTNWDLFLHMPTNSYYLRNDTAWLKATDLKGPWTPAGKLPESFMKLPVDDNWKDVRANLPGKTTTHAPTVYFSVAPAELILSEGEPKYVP